jgi:hypothetical protein
MPSEAFEVRSDCVRPCVSLVTLLEKLDDRVFEVVTVECRRSYPLLDWRSGLAVWILDTVID